MKEKVKKIPLWRLKLVIFYAMDIYIKSKSQDDFITTFKYKCGQDNMVSMDEHTAAIKHFKKEIYPLDKKLVEWVVDTFGHEQINLYTKIKELKKLGIDIK